MSLPQGCLYPEVRLKPPTLVVIFSGNILRTDVCTDRLVDGVVCLLCIYQWVFVLDIMPSAHVLNKMFPKTVTFL